MAHKPCDSIAHTLFFCKLSEWIIQLWFKTDNIKSLTICPICTVPCSRGGVSYVSLLYISAYTLFLHTQKGYYILCSSLFKTLIYTVVLVGVAQ